MVVLNNVEIAMAAHGAVTAATVSAENAVG
jgi:hypothetical protein